MLASIHVGPWKTGTSAFQQILRSNVAVLGDRGFDIPPGHFFVEAHHEIPAWLAGNLSKLMLVCGYSPLDPSRDGLSRYLRSLVELAREAGAHTLVLTSEDFAMLEWEAWTWLVEDLEAAGIQSVRITWSPFAPDERLLSYVSQYVRQGESISESEREELRGFIASLVPHTERLLAELSKTFGIDVRAVRYSRSPQYMRELIASVLSDDASRRLEEHHSTCANESLMSSDLERLNRFNLANVEGRAFDRFCPVIFSDEYPYQRQRLQMYTELLSEVGSLRSQLEEMQGLATQALHVQDELDAVYASRTWRMFTWWRRIRGRSRKRFR